MRCSDTARHGCVPLAAPRDPAVRAHVDDLRLLAQLRGLTDWRQGAEDRDVTVVQIVGSAVDAVDEQAKGLRERYALPRNQFSVVLIGKDGHVVVRSGEAVDGADLTRTVDAMPMRRAGQR